MRIKVAMCDDNTKTLPIIAGAARSAFHDRGVDIDLALFTSGEKLLASMEQTRYQLILLDIEMPRMDGIAVGKKLRAMGNDTKIVFVSEAESRVFESFQVQPLSFVRKSNFLNDITDLVDLYLKTCSREEAGENLEVAVRSGVAVVKSKNIRYIEGSGNYQMLYLDGKSEPMEVKMTMDKLEQMTELLGFIRVHKGFLVNYQYIHRVMPGEIILSDGTRIPIGRSHSGEVKAKFLSLVGG